MSVESPTNLHNHEGLGLLVGLWCGRLHDRIKTDDGMLEFAVGFQIGDVVVEPTGGKISNRGRLQTTGGQLKVVTSETDQSKKHGSVGGQFGINLTRWIGSLAKADINTGGQLDRTVSQSEQKNREVVQKFWRVADAGHNFWKVYGLDLNQDNVLEHKIIGDEPLCHIVPEQKSNSIDIAVSFRCSLKDLWFQRTSSVPARIDPRFDQKQSELNRSAVAARVAALALSRTTNIGEVEVAEGDVVLARQCLRAVRRQEDHCDE